MNPKQSKKTITETRLSKPNSKLTSINSKYYD